MHLGVTIINRFVQNMNEVTRYKVFLNWIKNCNHMNRVDKMIAEVDYFINGQRRTMAYYDFSTLQTV